MSGVIENLAAPEVYACRAVGMIFANGNIHLTFASPKADHSQPPGASVPYMVNLRLVMPLEQAFSLSAQLFEYSKEQGAVSGEVVQ